MQIAHSKLAHVMADWMGVEGRVQRVRLLDPGIGLTPDFPFSRVKAGHAQLPLNHVPPPFANLSDAPFRNALA